MRQRRLRNAQIRQQLAGTLLPIPQRSQDTETIVIRKGFRDFGEIMLLSLHTADLLLFQQSATYVSAFHIDVYRYVNLSTYIDLCQYISFPHTSCQDHETVPLQENPSRKQKKTTCRKHGEVVN